MAMDSGKREKVAYLAALVQRGELTCEEALAVSDETSVVSSSSRSSTVVSAGWWSLLTKKLNTCLNY